MRISGDTCAENVVAGILQNNDWIQRIKKNRINIAYKNIVKVTMESQ